LSFLLISIDQRQHHLEAVRSALSIVMYPIQVTVDFPIRLIRGAAENVASRRGLRADNASLRSQNLELNLRMQRYQALEQENRRLRMLLDTSYTVGPKVLVAELLAVDTSPGVHEIVINKGSRSGVFLGQPILDADGIMGQIVHVGPASSTAMLITDSRHAISVISNRSGVRGIAVGAGSMPQLELNFVPNNADIKEGDLIISSGMDAVFPGGYPVGEVAAVEFNPAAAFARILVRPRADLSRSREVLLVWSRPPGDPVRGDSEAEPVPPP
jgi:rod shape-determining protein MreC